MPDGAAALVAELPPVRRLPNAGADRAAPREAVRASQLTATLLFRRPGNLRVEWDGFQQSVQCRTPREHRVFYPQQQNYGDLTDNQFTGPLWNGFASAPRCLAALLEPKAYRSADDRRARVPTVKSVDAAR